MKEKRKFKKWEKIFIVINIIVILTICSIYTYRLVHYYKIEHTKYEVNTLLQVLTKNTTRTGDGLYILNENDYYFKGINVNNYIWYSGNLYRIISINDENLKLISDENLSIMAWGASNNFNNSYINNWLNGNKENNGVYINTIPSKDTYLKKFNYCSSDISEKCSNDIEYLSSLLTRSEYLNAGGKLSYLNNESNYWIIDDSKNNEKSYVFSEGGIGSEDDSSANLYSYGVRPVIVINGIITNFTGNGTKDNPYIIKEETGEKISDKIIGEYVSYNDYLFRIQDKNDSGIKLILDGIIPNYSTDYYNYMNYIKSNFIGKFNNLTNCNFNKGNYGINSNYDYKHVYTGKSTDNVGIPSIGDLYISDKDNYWLYNDYDINNLLAYRINIGSTIVADSKSSLNGIKPIICINNNINIISGSGTKNNPYILGG